ncbi:MAG: hypothetical protein ACJ8CR_34670 [Roseiflexaceae bacterium]
MSTTTHAHQEIPIACDLTAIPAGEREAHELLARQLFFETVPERQELPDGYAFRFRADQYPVLAEFIANERRCCPFFRFTLEVTPAQGPLWLRLTGGDGVKDFIQSAFPAVRPF